ncbi:hypothetical protein NEHOM01_0939 [Nematocida homosporus]|uniref:uncharacterized protein n=1 Tax=Nematocida homosporus TaxID=1912981 RepID=UPI00221E4141|nr:uncharacterized protein NEHOM01_0939 [Nematocida homosporus]KAI5185613.1 hypothetical protein NEHOM01_0939 [Nematocida homosporus]
MNMILIGVDTNVFLDSLECVKRLVVHLNSLNAGIFVPRVIIRELDAIKTKSATAREATKYILSEMGRSVNQKVFVENSIEVQGQTNDDTFAIACLNNHVDIILTNDTALRVKSISAGTPAIATVGKTAEDLCREIEEHLKDSDFMETELRGDYVGERNSVESSVAHLIYTKRLHPKLVKELGADLISDYVPDTIAYSLSAQLKYIVKNYETFTGMLPRYAKGIFQGKLKKELELADIEEILLILGIDPPEWFKQMQP